MLQECMIAERVSTWPWPPSFQSLKVHFPRWNSPLQYVRSMGVNEPSCSPAAATMTLKTDPGAYWLCSARFISGVSGSRTTLSHSSRSRLPVRRSSGNAGLEVMASTSPLRGSMTITAPEGIHLDALAAIAAAQVLVEHSLQPALADHVAAAVAPLLHLLVAHLPDVPEEMRGERARGIDPLGLDLDDDTGQLELALLDLGDFLERQSAPHADRAERVGRDALQRLLELAHGDLEQHRQSRQDGVAVIHLSRYERQGKGGAIVHEGEAVPVEEDAARRRDGTNPDTVLLGHLLELAALEHLQVPELAHQPDESHGDRGGQRDDATAPRLPSRGGFADQIHVCLLLSECTASTASTQAAPANPL